MHAINISVTALPLTGIWRLVFLVLQNFHTKKQQTTTTTKYVHFLFVSLFSNLLCTSSKVCYKQAQAAWDHPSQSQELGFFTSTCQFFIFHACLAFPNLLFVISVTHLFQKVWGRGVGTEKTRETKTLKWYWARTLIVTLTWLCFTINCWLKNDLYNNSKWSKQQQQQQQPKQRAAHINKYILSPSNPDINVYKIHVLGCVHAFFSFFPLFFFCFCCNETAWTQLHTWYMVTSPSFLGLYNFPRMQKQTHMDLRGASSTHESPALYCLGQLSRKMGQKGTQALIVSALITSHTTEIYVEEFGFSGHLKVCGPMRNQESYSISQVCEAFLNTNTSKVKHQRLPFLSGTLC